MSKIDMTTASAEVTALGGAARENPGDTSDRQPTNTVAEHEAAMVSEHMLDIVSEHTTDSTSISEQPDDGASEDVPIIEREPVDDKIVVGGANKPTVKISRAMGDEPLDPFDPERLRLSQDFAANLGVKKAMLTVPVRKPSKEWWIRTHPDEAYRIQTAVLELKEDRETYLVAPDLWPDLATESTFSPRALFTAINRQGVIFLWPVRLPAPDGKLDEWSRSALEAATMAIGGWVRVASNMSLGAYEVWETTAPLLEPQWPSLSFKDLLKVGFKGKFIESLDHPVLKKLRGEA